MAGFDPNSLRGGLAYWGALPEGAARGAATGRPRESDAARRTREIAAQRRAQQNAMLESLRSKILYANVVGIPDQSLIPMSALEKAGISSERTSSGLPYGIDPRSLNTDERAYLGLPLEAMYGGG